ncbi:autotransporter outer membrane beta-barrel domain-containing protein [Variovorax sp. GT1P44]|uniref:autotransporter outer membrane beta-barrel domain-containing protein n=1 Tax=Variovorax sp. GT1P44 TaxID=3443742 RepID=UPI003F46C928
MPLLPTALARKPCKGHPGCQRIAPFARKITAVSASVIAGLLASGASRPARADCLPNPPGNGQTVTCTGPAPTTVPLDASAASGVTVNVNPDAVITGNTNLIALGTGAQLNNFGSIRPVSTGAGNIGVVALGANSTLRNFGTLVTSGFNSLTFVSIGANSVLRNEAGGRITVNGDLATGLIASNTDDNQLINAGQITLNTFQGSGMFAQATNRSVLTNTATGVIESNLDEAFGMAASTGIGHVLRNDGSIVTRGQGSHGMLLVETSGSSMTNAGSITTSGGSSETVNRAFGMFVAGGGGNIVQNVAGGTITASGIGSSGMEIDGSTGTLLRNDGTVNVSGTGAHGLYVLSGSNNTLENRGTVNTSGQRGNGMRADDGDSTFINSGSLLVGGRDAFGVFMQGTNNTLLNSGTIRASGINADGVLSNTVAGSFVARIENTGSIISERSFAVRGVNGQESLINSGVIRSDVGTAIDLRGGNDTLTLRTGSQITGLADGGTGTDGVILEGTGTASNAFANFETLRMTGSDWAWAGSGAFNDTQVESGALRVSGTLTSPATVRAGAQLHIGVGGASGTVAGGITDNGALVFNRSDAITYSGVIGGTGTLTQAGTGTTTLTGANTLTGPTTVAAGTLRVNGSLASAATTVQNAATLGGTGRIAGSVTVQDGGHIAPGASPGTLTIGGDLSLSPGSVLDYELGQANMPGGAVNDLTVVGGNLRLDGTVNVTQPPGGSFGPGIYRLINYGGALNNQGLNIGAMPAGGPFLVQTSLVNQVNLVNTQGLVLNFWDGNNAALFNNAAVNGGAGTWLASTNDGWTDSAGTVNAPWQPNGFAIFQGTPGTVAVDNGAGAVTFSGAQFTTDGYTVTGQPLTTTTADTIIRVGDGTAAGAAMTATIGAAIQGSGGIDKTDLGTLVLTAANTYTGNTTVDGGTLSVRGGAIDSPAATIAVGVSGTGTLRLENGARVNGTTSVIGANAGSQGAVVVTGSGSAWTTGSGLTIGDVGAGSLTVENGGVVQSGFALGAFQGSGTATIHVSGTGSRWTTSGFVSLLSGTSTMTIDQAGQVRGGSVVIGENAGAQATAVVSGPGSTLTSDSTFEVARAGTGSLTVSGGATVTSAQGFVGRVAGGVGNAVVTGAGSSWVNTGPDLTVGNGGTGTLTISEGAAVSAPATYVAFYPGSVGTLNIGGATGNAPAVPGLLDTPTVALGDGTATINFNHTSSSYEFAPLMTGTGTVNALAGTTILTADNSYAGATTIAAPATLQMGNGGTTGSITSNVANDGTLVFDRSDVLTYDGLISGTGHVVQQGTGTLILQGASSFSGGTTVNAGTLVVGDAGSRDAALGGGGTVLVNPGATLGGYGSVTGDVVNNGVLKVADAIASAAPAPVSTKLASKPAVLAGGNGSFTVNGTLQNAGLAQLGAVNGTPGNALIVNSYVGASGSRVALNTFLGADNSPSDRLIINGGSARGASTLQITNAGGGGALTTGDGIAVVDAANGATTAGSAFALGSRVAAGAYEYLLFKGGAANGESWYLRTTLPATATATAALPGAAPPPAPAPSVVGSVPSVVGSAPSVAMSAPLPNYRVEVPLDMSAPVLANRLGIAMLGTYHDRAGEDSVSPTSEGPSRLGTWGRVFGASGEVRNGSGGTNTDRFNDFTRNGPSYDYNEAGVQTGIDLLRRADANGQSDVAGAFIAVGHIDSDVDAIYGGKAGTASMDGYSLGGYWTRKGASGWYVDGVLQGTRYDSVKTRSILGEALATDGWGVAASLEAGYPFALAPGWALEPQGQLVYQWTRLDDGRDNFARVSFDDTSTFYGRIGARLTHRIAQGLDGQEITAWARLNVWHAFDSDATTTFTSLQGFNPVALSAPLGASTWAQAGVGLSGSIARNVTAFGSVDYNRSLDSGDSHGWSGRVGVRFKW